VKAFVAAVALMAALVPLRAVAQSPAARPDPPRSGITYAGSSIVAMQADDAANPGLLWVDRGAQLWHAPAAGSPSCNGCHDEASMHGVAARLPAWDATAGRVVDLEDRINGCRATRQHAAPLARGSEDLVALTAFVASQSRGVPMNVRVDGPAAPAFQRARLFYNERRGQMDLACTSCHDDLAGRRLLNETISQGQPTAFPAYRLEWQAVGSLQRRLRACLFGIRATMPDEGAQVLTELELYLAWRAQGLPVEAPGVRR
jgi:L-cysteine S-thiosulfotransferase